MEPGAGPRTWMSGECSDNTSSRITRVAVAGMLPRPSSLIPGNETPIKRRTTCGKKADSSPHRSNPAPTPLLRHTARKKPSRCLHITIHHESTKSSDFFLAHVQRALPAVPQVSAPSTESWTARWTVHGAQVLRRRPVLHIGAVHDLRTYPTRNGLRGQVPGAVHVHIEAVPRGVRHDRGRSLVWSLHQQFNPQCT
jgi:hypothetical protein